MHPLARPNNRSGFYDIESGDKVTDGTRIGIMDEALQDGEAYVSWDDGSYTTASWNELKKVEVELSEE